MIVAIMRPCGVAWSKAKPFIAMTDTCQVSNSFSVWRRSSVLRPQRDAPLGQRHHFLPFSAIELCPRARLLEHPDHLVTSARGKGGEIALLTRTPPPVPQILLASGDEVME
jgi:hypothetical protein